MFDYILLADITNDTGAWPGPAADAGMRLSITERWQLLPSSRWLLPAARQPSVRQFSTLEEGGSSLGVMVEVEEVGGGGAERLKGKRSDRDREETEEMVRNGTSRLKDLGRPGSNLHLSQNNNPFT
ncbi:unnamed protein product [Merluccius merluccius]